jgi:hypothetical protein
LLGLNQGAQAVAKNRDVIRNEEAGNAAMPPRQDSTR